jgi:hypothetical protein
MRQLHTRFLSVFTRLTFPDSAGEMTMKPDETQPDRDENRQITATDVVLEDYEDELRQVRDLFGVENDDVTVLGDPATDSVQIRVNTNINLSDHEP